MTADQDREGPLTADDGSAIEPTQAEMNDMRDEDITVILVRSLIAVVDEVEQLTETVNAVGKLTRVPIRTPAVFADLRYVLKGIEARASGRSYAESESSAQDPAQPSEPSEQSDADKRR